MKQIFNKTNLQLIIFINQLISKTISMVQGLFY